MANSGDTAIKDDLILALEGDDSIPSDTSAPEPIPQAELTEWLKNNSRLDDNAAQSAASQMSTVKDSLTACLDGDVPTPEEEAVLAASDAAHRKEDAPELPPSAQDDENTPDENGLVYITRTFTVDPDTYASDNYKPPMQPQAAQNPATVDPDAEADISAIDVENKNEDAADIREAPVAEGQPTPANKKEEPTAAEESQAAEEADDDERKDDTITQPQAPATDEATEECYDLGIKYGIYGLAKATSEVPVTDALPGKAPTRENCETTFQNCKAKNPLFCRFHGPKLLELDIAKGLSAAIGPVLKEMGDGKKHYSKRSFAGRITVERDPNSDNPRAFRVTVACTPEEREETEAMLDEFLHSERGITPADASAPRDENGRLSAYYEIDDLEVNKPPKGDFAIRAKMENDKRLKKAEAKGLSNVKPPMKEKKPVAAQPAQEQPAPTNEPPVAQENTPPPAPTPAQEPAPAPVEEPKRDDGIYIDNTDEEEEIVEEQPPQEEVPPQVPPPVKKERMVGPVSKSDFDKAVADVANNVGWNPKTLSKDLSNILKGKDTITPGVLTDVINNLPEDNSVRKAIEDVAKRDGIEPLADNPDPDDFEDDEDPSDNNGEGDENTPEDGTEGQPDNTNPNEPSQSQEPEQEVQKPVGFTNDEPEHFEGGLDAVFSPSEKEAIERAKNDALREAQADPEDKEKESYAHTLSHLLGSSNSTYGKRAGALPGIRDDITKGQFVEKAAKRLEDKLDADPESYMGAVRAVEKVGELAGLKGMQIEGSDITFDDGNGEPVNTDVPSEQEPVVEEPPKVEENVPPPPPVEEGTPEPKEEEPPMEEVAPTPPPSPTPEPPKPAPKPVSTPSAPMAGEPKPGDADYYDPTAKPVYKPSEEEKAAIQRLGMDAFKPTPYLKKDLEKLRPHISQGERFAQKARDLETVLKGRENAAAAAKAAASKPSGGVAVQDESTIVRSIADKMKSISDEDADRFVNTTMTGTVNESHLKKFNNKRKLPVAEQKLTKKFLAASLPDITKQCPGLESSISQLHYIPSQTGTNTLAQVATCMSAITGGINGHIFSHSPAKIKNSFDEAVRTGRTHELVGLDSRTAMGFFRCNLMHELGHSLLSFKGVPDKWIKAYNAATAQDPQWAGKVSDYAKKNKSECHCEALANYTKPGYKKGTMPKPIEDYFEDVLSNGPGTAENDWEGVLRVSGARTGRSI